MPVLSSLVSKAYIMSSPDVQEGTLPMFDIHPFVLIVNEGKAAAFLGHADRTYCHMAAYLINISSATH